MATLQVLDLTPFRQRGSQHFAAFAEQEAKLVDLHKRLQVSGT